MVPTKKARLILIEDHVLFQQGLKTLLAGQGGFDMVGEAGDGKAGIDLYERLRPDLVILDLSLPDMGGGKVARRIFETDPQARILALTVHGEDEYIHDALSAGIQGYVLKESSNKELLMVIEDVLSGKTSVCPEVTPHVLQGYLERKAEKAADLIASLSLREAQILQRVGDGTKNKEIALELGLSVKTIEKHKACMKRKLSLGSVSELRHIALKVWPQVD